MLNGFTPNVPYMLSRATGKNVLYLSILAIMLVLRKTITLLSEIEFQFRKITLVGTLIFVLGSIHTICPARSSQVSLIEWSRNRSFP